MNIADERFHIRAGLDSAAIDVHHAGTELERVRDRIDRVVRAGHADEVRDLSAQVDRLSGQQRLFAGELDHVSGVVGEMVRTAAVRSAPSGLVASERRI
jgi:hypothetical protein